MKPSIVTARNSLAIPATAPCRCQKWEPVIRLAIDALNERSDYVLNHDDYLIARQYGGAVKRFEYGIIVEWLAVTQRTIFFNKGTLKFYVIPSQWLLNIFTRSSPNFKRDKAHDLWTVYLWFHYDQFAQVGYSNQPYDRDDIAEYAHMMKR